MSHVITELCVGTKDASCVEVCPVDCIHPRPDEPDFAGAKTLHIDPMNCIDCGLCVDECPVRAIYPENDLPQEWSDHGRLNAAYYADVKTPDK